MPTPYRLASAAAGLAMGCATLPASSSPVMVKWNALPSDAAGTSSSWPDTVVPGAPCRPGAKVSPLM
jgi:hypothetical protein